MNLLGEELIELNKKMICYPNPSTDQVNLKLLVLEEQEAVDILLFDLSGTQLKQKKIKTQLGVNNSSLNVSNLPNGAYIINAKIGDNMVSEKIIKY